MEIIIIKIITKKKEKKTTDQCPNNFRERENLFMREILSKNSNIRQSF